MGWTRKLNALTVIAVVITATSAFSATAAPAKKRTVEATYHTPAAMIEVGGGGAYACSPGAAGGTLVVGCVDVPVGPTERFVTIEATDATGLPAPFWFGQADAPTDEYVCGKTEGPVKIAPGIPLEIWMYPYRVDPLCEGISTSGTLTLTFSGQ